MGWDYLVAFLESGHIFESSILALVNIKDLNSIWQHVSRWWLVAIKQMENDKDRFSKNHSTHELRNVIFLYKKLNEKVIIQIIIIIINYINNEQIISSLDITKKRFRVWVFTKGPFFSTSIFFCLSVIKVTDIDRNTS